MRHAPHARLGIVFLGPLAWATACVPWWRENAHASRDFYEQWQNGPECARPIALFEAHAAPGRPSRQLADISTTCYPGSIELCERRLKERACALGADAVILTESQPGPNPAGGNRQFYVSRSGRAVRWED